MYRIACVFSFFVQIVLISSQTCEYVSDTIINVHDSKSDEWNQTRFSGCITNASFVNQEIIDIEVYCIESLPVLEKHFVSNMHFLTYIGIDSCHIEKLEPGAFFNSPNIKHLIVTGNPLEEISRGVLDVIPGLEILRLFDNRIARIEDHALGNLPNLNTLLLYNNNLDSLRREWFTNTTNIEELDLHKNFIRKIPCKMFHGWRKLKKLNLASNAISVLGDDLFKNNPKVMKYVDLHNNRLRSISPSSISNSTYINHLVISGNLLNYLPESFLRSIRVAAISIFNNPFKCPCLEKINEVLLKKGVTVNNPRNPFRETNILECMNENIPSCGNSINATSTTCVETVDKELTHRLISYMKKLQYDTVVDKLGQQCARFDDSDD